MNFTIFRKLIALPLSTSENSIGCVLAFHVQKGGNSCFPSYETINKESGASNKTISKVIRTLKYAGVLDYRHRAQIGTNTKVGGKESNEYIFIFDDIGFYRNKLTREKTISFKAKLRVARMKAIEDMKLESENRKLKSSSPIPSQMLRYGKSQSVKSDVCNVAGLEGGTIPSHFSPIPSQMLRRSNRENVPLINDSTSNDTTIELRNSEKTVRHDKKVSSISPNEHDSNITCLAENKKPTEQTNEEWLADYEG